MRIVPHTVRAKLTTLVGIPLALLCVMLPVLWTALHGELLDEADDRLLDAEHSFQTELDDDLAALRLASRVLSEDEETRAALESHNVEQSLEMARTFGEIYPHVDVLLVDATGAILADVGPTRVPPRADDVPELRDLHALASGVELHAIAQHGCAAPSEHAPPARMLAAAAAHAGWVVVCEPLDTAYVTNAARKLGLALALLDGGDGTELSALTPDFPRNALSVTRSAPVLLDAAGTTFAVSHFVPRLVDGTRGGTLAVVAAMDVGDLKRVVNKHMFLALGSLLLVALVSIGMGARMAGVMSDALKQVIDAFRKLERQEYVRVKPLRTRDELESLASGFNQMVDGLIERDKLRTTFGKYMTESVVAHLMSGKVSLGGETIKVTILFTDIRSFTSISEKMEAHALVALLNEYFTEMVGIVMRHNGVVDKYIGDAIMAVFGAPVPSADDAKNAVRAAVEMRAALAKLNDSLRARGLQEIQTGIGIHTGEVVAGNIGSEQRMEYTVIGDAVNLASRLESSTKELGAHVLISDATYAETRDVVQTRAVKEITVKGRQQPVMTYEVLGLRANPEG